MANSALPISNKTGKGAVFDTVTNAAPANNNNKQQQTLHEFH
jgi:hypothetical protein